MPQRVPFWNSDFDRENPGPLGALTAASLLDRQGETVSPEFDFNGTYQRNPWDTATLKSIKVPGLVKVRVKRARHIWTIQAPGASPTPIKAGYEPLKFTMTVKVWTPAQWWFIQPLMWDVLPVSFKPVPDLRDARGRKIKDNQQRADANSAFDIDYPSLRSFSVNACICEDMDFTLDGEVGTITWQFLEYRRGKSTVAAIDGAEASPAFNNGKLKAKEVNVANGKNIKYTPTHGPQQKPSQAGVTLTPTTG